MPGRAILPVDGMPPRTQCTGISHHSRERCRAKAEPGTTRCRFHGGRHPTVRKEAEERINHYRDRLVSMGDEALDTIHRKLTSPNEAVSLRAALEILDRSGVITTRKTESSVTVTTRSQLDEKISELLDAQERLGDDVATSPSPPSPPTSFHAGAPATFANITDPFRPSRDDDLPAFTSPSHSHSAGLGLSSTDLTNDDTIPPPPPPPPPF